MIQDLRSVLNQTANIQKMLLNQQGLKQLSKTQIEDISKTPPILGSLLLILDYQTQLFEYIQVKLVPNILVLQNQYLVLSNCTIQKYQVFHQTSEIKGIQLTSPKGVLYLFFKQRQQLAEWKAKLKTFCKLFNFLKKFKILDQFNREFYTIQKKKSKEIYSVQICQKTTDISKEAKYCEIQTLRSIKHQGLLDLKWVYEDQSNIFLVFEPFSGQKLDDLLLQGLSFQEVQLASIVLQILSLVKFLHKNGIYHGNINPSSIIVNSSNSYLQIYLINLVNIQIQPDKSICMIFQIIVEIDPADIYKQVIQKIYISPEILEDKSQPSVQSDLYAIGVFMYQLIFYGHYNANSESIDYDLIQKSEAFLESKQINFNVKSQNRMLYSISQIDLMKRLLKPADQRITLQDAMKHQWFINVKSKLRPKQIRKRKLPLPSLKTIIELCELQERNSSLLAYDDEQVSDEDMKIDSLMEQLHSVEEKIPSKESHIKYKQFTTYKSSQYQSTDKNYKAYQTFT